MEEVAAPRGQPVHIYTCILSTYSFWQRSGMDTSQGDVVSLAITEVQVVFHVNKVELAEDASSLATRLKCSSEMCDNDKLFWTKDSKRSYILFPSSSSSEPKASDSHYCAQLVHQWLII